MPDEKFGCLFTETDVEELINIATGAATSGEVLNLKDCLNNVGRPMTFPADEPLFVLRGKDAAAYVGIGAYIDEAERIGASPEFLRRLAHSGGQFLAWQMLHKDRTKTPD